jgi:hypothetical protein
MTAPPRLTAAGIDLFEREVRLRMPFRFGVGHADAGVCTRAHPPDRRPARGGHGRRAAGADVFTNEFNSMIKPWLGQAQAQRWA